MLSLDPSNSPVNIVTEKETKAQMWACPKEYNTDFITQLPVSPTCHAHKYIAIEIMLSYTFTELENLEHLGKDTWNH